MSLNKAMQKKRQTTLSTLAIKTEYAIKKKKKIKCGSFSLVFLIKAGGSMTEIFSVGLQKTDKGIKDKLNL